LLNIPVAVNCTCPCDDCASAFGGLRVIDWSTRFEVEFIEPQPIVAIEVTASKQNKTKAVGTLREIITILLGRQVYNSARSSLSNYGQFEGYPAQTLRGASRCSADATIVISKIPPITAREISVRIG
jgi:hypothetical protein